MVKTAQEAFDEIYFSKYKEGAKGTDAFEAAQEKFKEEYSLQPPYKSHISYKSIKSRQRKRKLR